MAHSAQLLVLFVGHSAMSLFSDFCSDRNIQNFGLPSPFHADICSLPEATIQDLPSVLEEILLHRPAILIFDFGSFDLLHPSDNLLQPARAFHSFIRFISFLLVYCSGCFPIIFVIEQHFWMRPPYPSVPCHI